MTAKPKDVAVISNRSLCWARLNEGSNALKDAVACIILSPDWPIAYYRAGIAWRILKVQILLCVYGCSGFFLGGGARGTLLTWCWYQDYERAAEAFEMGLMMYPGNKDLQNAKRSAKLSFAFFPNQHGYLLGYQARWGAITFLQLLGNKYTGVLEI